MDNPENFEKICKFLKKQYGRTTQTKSGLSFYTRGGGGKKIPKISLALLLKTLEPFKHSKFRSDEKNIILEQGDT